MTETQELQQLRRENAELRQRCESTYCAYCGDATFIDDEAGEKVAEHIRTCPKHPMRAVEKERDTLRRELARALKVLATVEHVYPGRFKTGLGRENVQRSKDLAELVKETP